MAPPLNALLLAKVTPLTTTLPKRSAMPPPLPAAMLPVTLPPERETFPVESRCLRRSRLPRCF